MATIVNENLAGATVEYNGVQFGGADATYKSYPPTYSMRCDERWDSSGRAVEGYDITIRVRCVFFETSVASMELNMRAIRLALGQPGRLLKLNGLGSGFDWVANPRSGVGGQLGDVVDMDNGPKPGPIEMNPIGGQLAWELLWSVKFFVVPCITAGTSIPTLAFTSFNFTTTWSHDYEGHCTRSVSGRVSIPMSRGYASPKTVLHIADETRGSIAVTVPTNFKRVSNVWQETEDHGTLQFNIVDEQLKGDAYPPGISAASGNFSFVSGGENNPTMTRSVCTLSAALQVAHGRAPNLAGRIFIIAALSKQTELMAIDGDGKATVVVIPLHLMLNHGLWDNARMTQCSMSWVVTKNLNACMAAAKIWQPISANLTAMGGSQDYTQWAASMASLWGNRGTAGLTGNVSEAVIIDLCDNVTSKTIGTGTSYPSSHADENLDSLVCPTLPDNGGWIHFDLDIQVHRSDKSHSHRRAASYLPNVGDIFGYQYDAQPGSGADAINLGGSLVSMSGSDEHIVEHNGYPETLIGLSFSGLRFVNKAFMPEIKSVGGFPVILKEQQGGTPKQVMDSFGCPIWSVTGYRVYRMTGYTNTIKPISSLVATDTSIPYDL